jgi:hypothetical protein
MVGKRLFLAILIGLGASAIGGAMEKKDGRKAGVESTFSLLDKYPEKIEFNGREYFANVTVAAIVPAFIHDANIWVMRAAWTDGGSVVEIVASPYPCLKLNEFLAECSMKVPENNSISTRFVKLGEMKFLEKDFIESLPVATRRICDLIIISSQVTYIDFRISTSEDIPGKTFVTYISHYPNSDELNPAYGKLNKDFRSAIAWVFAEWLMEDGHEVDENWLEMVRKYYPIRKFDE